MGLRLNNLLQDMLEFLAQFRRQIFVTVDRLMTAEPEYIVMGMSLETFFGGWGIS